MRLKAQPMCRVLTPDQKVQFVQEGIVKLEGIFSPVTASHALAILWQASGCDPNDSRTRTRPVVRLGDFAQEPFRQAVNNPTLYAAFDELIGEGR